MSPRTLIGTPDPDQRRRVLLARIAELMRRASSLTARHGLGEAPNGVRPEDVR